MNLKSLKLSRAASIVSRTMPILLVRLGVYLAFWVVTLIYLGVTGAVAWLLSQAWTPLGVIGFIAALIGIGPLYQLAYRYVFYMIKAAHIAVVSEILVNDRLPEGTSQLEWGRQAVTNRFGEANAMFVIDEMVDAVVRSFTYTVYSVANMLPGETMENLARVLRRVVNYAMSYIDEAILARSFWRRDESVWTSATEGVVLYGQAWKPILMNAIALTVVSYIAMAVIFVVLVFPIAGITALIFNASAGGWAALVTLILAYLLKVAVADAFVMTAMVATYQDETQDLTPNPEMAARLEQVSDKFRELKSKAEGAVSGGQASQPGAADIPA